jgi:hypothetical protein
MFRSSEAPPPSGENIKTASDEIKLITTAFLARALAFSLPLIPACPGTQTRETGQLSDKIASAFWHCHTSLEVNYLHKVPSKLPGYRRIYKPYS